MAHSGFRGRLTRFLLAFAVLLVLVSLRTKTFAAADDGAGGGGGGNCNADLSSVLPPPFSNMSFAHCKPVWNTYAIRFVDTKEHVLTIVLSAEYTTGWVGIGFSKDGKMVGSSAMVGWINRHGRAKIKQYYLRGLKASEVIPEKGELPLTNVPAAVVLHEATIHLAFQLKFEHALRGQPILLAFSTAYPTHHHLSKHVDKTTIMFDFAEDPYPETKNYNQFKKNHGILAIFGWALVLPFGAIVARYFKHKDPLWYYLHTVIQFVGFIFVLSAVVVGQVLYNGIDANVPAHRNIGIFAFVLIILQILAFFVRPDVDSKIRRYWNWYHHWFGRLALFFGAVNIVLGIQVGGAGNSWKIGYGFLLSVILVTVIVLEALSWMRRSDKTGQHPAFQMNPI
ncbi:cytochrome b561 and DOMON domain-containing protein At3g61750 [Malania oleifera]|uniref:cytochrome b561 and DOMON domain-containing protein At3g61750 n=1 Tax=Malania oleifera TaxID=397392 RepID=UPI0025ADA171|nr:cytochrome b561 and DOMON domain-containing protein At3g61750 [Malania oleifera]